MDARAGSEVGERQLRAAPRASGARPRSASRRASSASSRLAPRSTRRPSTVPSSRSAMPSGSTACSSSMRALAEQPRAAPRVPGAARLIASPGVSISTMSWSEKARSATRTAGMLRRGAGRTRATRRARRSCDRGRPPACRVRLEREHADREPGRGVALGQLEQRGRLARARSGPTTASVRWPVVAPARPRPGGSLRMRARTRSRSGASGWNGRSDALGGRRRSRARCRPATPARSSSSSGRERLVRDGRVPGSSSGACRGCDVHPVVRRLRCSTTIGAAIARARRRPGGDRAADRVTMAGSTGPDRAGEVGQRELLDRCRVGRRRRRGGRLAARAPRRAPSRRAPRAPCRRARRRAPARHLGRARVAAACRLGRLLVGRHAIGGEHLDRLRAEEPSHAALQALALAEDHGLRARAPRGSAGRAPRANGRRRS